MRMPFPSTALGAFMAILLFGTIAQADLDAYIKKPEPVFAWKVEQNHSLPAGRNVRLNLTSQEWQGIVWQHRLEIYEPKNEQVKDTMLLFITGGSSTSQPRDEDAVQGFGLAELCGATCAVLHQVPNQPLLDGRKEDDLIAETFMKYLATKDENWPLLFPMVKSAVKAMDALQAWARQQGKPEVKKFVVTGGSKRGWTTWLTAAVDDRVAAIAPMVIVMLNMRAQNPHQLEVWGKYSEQIEDYTRRGLTEKIDTPEGQKLWKMVDPFWYRDRLTMPKLLINGTNDRYWTLDAMNLYWDDLKGPKWDIYLPNAGHGLEKNREYATHGIAALFHSVTQGPGLPKLSWKFEKDAQGNLRLSVNSSVVPRSARVWTAHSDTKDFRESPWTSTPMLIEENSISASIARPEKGYGAAFGDLEFQIDGIEYHLSTQIEQTQAPGAK